MHILKKILAATTGYWIHKISTLPVGADLFIDIHKRLQYGQVNTMFDVGANTGQTWEWFRANEPKARIYCFEPVSGTFKLLESKAGKDKNSVLECLAFGDIEGEKRIRLFDEYSVLNSLKDDLMNSNRDATEEVIKIDTLDNYCSRHGIAKIDMLKIDTEGYELNVLEGAKRMLDTSAISFIYCETGFLERNKRNSNFALLSEWLALKNYFFLGLYQLSSNSWKAGNYFGNALFVHRDVFNPS